MGANMDRDEMCRFQQHAKGGDEAVLTHQVDASEDKKQGKGMNLNWRIHFRFTE